MKQIGELIKEMKERADKNLADAKVLIQPEKSWIRDQESITRLIAALERIYKVLPCGCNDEQCDFCFAKDEAEEILRGEKNV